MFTWLSSTFKYPTLWRVRLSNVRWFRRWDGPFKHWFGCITWQHEEKLRRRRRNTSATRFDYNNNTSMSTHLVSGDENSIWFVNICTITFINQPKKRLFHREKVLWWWMEKHLNNLIFLKCSQWPTFFMYCFLRWQPFNFSTMKKSDQKWLLIDNQLCEKSLKKIRLENSKIFSFYNCSPFKRKKYRYS